MCKQDNISHAVHWTLKIPSIRFPADLSTKSKSTSAQSFGPPPFNANEADSKWVQIMWDSYKELKAKEDARLMDWTSVADWVN